jgi:hypothetical protein
MAQSPVRTREVAVRQKVFGESVGQHLMVLASFFCDQGFDSLAEEQLVATNSRFNQGNE